MICCESYKKLNLTIQLNIFWTKNIRLENKMHKILQEFQMQLNYLIPARRPDLEITIENVEIV